MEAKKYRISIAESTGIGSTSHSPIDVESFDDFVLYLKNEGIRKFSLKYHSIMDDIPDFHEMGFSFEDFKQEHFDWLVEKSKWQSRYLEIVTRTKNKPEMKDDRNENFKIGTFHGTLNPVKGSREAKLRNALYLIGNLTIPLTRKEEIKIRLIGYEIPIENKGKRIDLIGYDKDMNPWIIELKADISQEKISEILTQVEGYSRILPTLIEKIQNEFHTKFFIELKLSKKIRKVIIAPREFFAKQDKSTFPKIEDIFLCSIAKVKEVFNEMKELTFDSKFNQFDEITLKIENR